MKIGEITKEIAKRNPEAIERVKKDLAFQIGLMVEQARLSLGMTQVELAEKINTKQPAIARLESGNNLPSLTILDKIAKLGFGSYLISPQFAFMQSVNTGKNIINNTAAGDKSAVMHKIESPFKPVLTSSGITMTIENPGQFQKIFA